MAEHQLLVLVKTCMSRSFFPAAVQRVAQKRSGCAARRACKGPRQVKIVSRAGGCALANKTAIHTHARRELTQSALRGRRRRSAGDL
jgi:hypothetical protein